MLHERAMTWAAGRQDRKYKLTIRAGPGVGIICFIVMLQVIAFVWRWGALPISLCRHVCLCSCLCLDCMLHSIVHSPPLPIKTLLSKFLEPCSLVSMWEFYLSTNTTHVIGHWHCELQHVGDQSHVTHFTTFEILELHLLMAWSMRREHCINIHPSRIEK